MLHQTEGSADKLIRNLWYKFRQAVPQCYKVFWNALCFVAILAGHYNS